jgi:hypothetical protein
MPVTAELKNGHAYYTATDFVAVDEALETVVAFNTTHTAKHAIWDFRNGDLTRFSPDLFKRAAQGAAKFAWKRGPGAKTAFYVATRDEVLLIKAFAGMAEGETEIAFAAFTDFDELMAWLDT